MAEILSQDEINALLSAYESPEGAAPEMPSDKSNKKIRSYDFSRPDKFSKDHLRTINMIHANYAAVLGSALTTMYQVTTHVSLIGVDQISYKEYRSSIPSKTLLAEVAIDSSGAEMFFEVNPGIVGVWVDYLCGAGAHASSQPSNLTSIDLAITKRVLDICMGAYSDAWAGFISLEPEVKHVVNGENYECKLLPAEVVLVCSLEVQTAATTGMMTICIPAVSVESKLPKLTSSRMTSSTSERTGQLSSKETIKLLDPVSLPCRVVMGNASIPFTEAKQLQVGDIIKIDKHANSEIEYWVGNKHLFNCRPGIKGKNLAIVISSANEPFDLDDLEKDTPIPERLAASAA